jgi:predicted dehydrogenase
VDAVHIDSPIADHAPQSIAALEAGKHVASTVPAATTIDECRQIVESQRSGKVYMMMETVVYSREYLFAKELYDRGELGRIQFLRGSHQQDNYAHLLPEPLRRFTQRAAIQDADHLSFLQGGGHGGSHSHLVHNFLMACLGRQPAMPDAETSVNWTMVGICAHQSALKGGEKIEIPRF